jgi:hypothetical protein
MCAQMHGTDAFADTTVAWRARPCVMPDDGRQSPERPEALASPNAAQGAFGSPQAAGPVVHPPAFPAQAAGRVA